VTVPVRRRHLTLGALLTFAVAGCSRDPVTPRLDASADPPNLTGVILAQSAPRPIVLTYLCGNRFRLRTTFSTPTRLRYDVYRTTEVVEVVAPPTPWGTSYFEQFFETLNRGTVRILDSTGTVRETKANGGTSCAAPLTHTVQILHEVVEPSATAYSVRTVAHRDSVPYAFAPASPTDSVVVFLDDTPVPPAGVVPARANHVLVARSFPAARSSAALSEWRAALASFALAPDPATELPRLDAAADAMVGAYGAAASHVTRRVLAEVLYDPATPQVFDRIDSVMANRMFDLELPPVPARAALAADVVPVRTEPTAFVFVNGINTDFYGWLARRDQLANLIASAPLVARSVVRRSRYWNPTRREFYRLQDSTRLAYCEERLHSLTPLASPRESRELVVFCARSGGSAQPDTAMRGVAWDIAGAAAAIWRLRTGRGVGADARALADTLTDIRATGSHVLVVGHSEGGLIAQEALVDLGRRGTLAGPPDSTGIAVVTLGAPTTAFFTAPFDPRRGHHLSVRGDGVADIGATIGLPNSGSRVDTPRSVAAQRELGSLPPANGGLAAQVQSRRYGLRFQHLHELEAYIAESERPMPDSITAGAERVLRELVLGSVGIPSGGTIQLPIGASVDVAGLFSVRNLNDWPLSGRRVTYSTAAPAIATVTGTSLLTGVAPGTTTLVASTGGVTGTITVVVPSATPTLFGTATWYAADPTNGFVEVRSIVGQIIGASGVGTVTSISGSSAFIRVPTGPRVPASGCLTDDTGNSGSYRLLQGGTVTLTFQDGSSGGVAVPTVYAVYRCPAGFGNPWLRFANALPTP
jgi:hypothetical protein